MFSLTKPGRDEVEAQMQAASRLPLMQPQFLDLQGGLKGGQAPTRYAHDRSRTQVGQGRPAFDAAVSAFNLWKEFDLGWVHVANAGAPITSGQIVAVVARTFALWSLSLSQIVEVMRTGDSLGFLYKTTAEHVEEGEERFVLTLDGDGAVWYEIEAVSRPRHVMTRIGVPFARAFQHRFVRDSHRRIRQVATAASQA